MNVISFGMLQLMKVPLKRLDQVGFEGLSMKTADHRQTLLYNWMEFEFESEGVTRNIKCFVATRLSLSNDLDEHVGLILGIPWLYSVDAHIAIRGSSITIGDRTLGETPRTIQGTTSILEAFPTQPMPGHTT